MTGFWNFLSARINPFRVLKLRLKSVEDSYPKIAEADELLESTRVQGNANYGKADIAEAAVTDMLGEIVRVGSAITLALHFNFVVVRRMVGKAQEYYAYVRMLRQPLPSPIQKGKAELDAAVAAFDKMIARTRIEIENARQDIENAFRYFSTTTTRRSIKTAMGDAQASRGTYKQFVKEVTGLGKSLTEYAEMQKQAQKLKVADAGAERKSAMQKEKMEREIYDQFIRTTQLLTALTNNIAESSHQMVLVLYAQHDMTLDAVKTIKYLKEHGFTEEKINAFERKIGEIWQARKGQLDKLGGEATYLKQHDVRIAT